jgi:uncharacterized coiled-coil protein SlyX
VTNYATVVLHTQFDTLTSQCAEFEREIKRLEGLIEAQKALMEKSKQKLTEVTEALKKLEAAV